MNGEELQKEVVKGTRLVARRDPAMASLIKRAGPMDLRDPLPDSFAALVRSRSTAGSSSCSPTASRPPLSWRCQWAPCGARA